MTFCPECGSGLGVGSIKFCPNCGMNLWQTLSNATTVSSSPSPPESSSSSNTVYPDIVGAKEEPNVGRFFPV